MDEKVKTEQVKQVKQVKKRIVLDWWIAGFILAYIVSEAGGKMAGMAGNLIGFVVGGGLVFAGYWRCRKWRDEQDQQRR